MLKRDAAFVILALEAVAIVGVVFFLVTLDFMSVAWSLSIAIAIPAWLLAVKAPTVCGVTTQKGGQCSRRVNGVIFGCGTSNHTWAKFFSRFGWRRQPDPNTSSGKTGAAASFSTAGNVTASGVEMMTVRIAEDTKSKVAFWLALTATTCGLVSATVDATNFIKDQRAPAKALAAFTAAQLTAESPTWVRPPVGGAASNRP
jgi:hypothetical protein